MSADLDQLADQTIYRQSDRECLAAAIGFRLGLDTETIIQRGLQDNGAGPEEWYSFLEEHAHPSRDRQDVIDDFYWLFVRAGLPTSEALRLAQVSPAKFASSLPQGRVYHPDSPWNTYLSKLHRGQSGFICERDRKVTNRHIVYCRRWRVYDSAIGHVTILVDWLAWINRVGRNVEYIIPTAD